MQGSSSSPVREWTHLPAVAIQAVAQRCCPASRARLRLTCTTWHQALATQYTTLYMGPGSPCWQPVSTAHDQSQEQHISHIDACVLGSALHTAFPAVTAMKLTASSSREYEEAFTQDLALVLASQHRLTHLTLYEVHELEELDTLDPASLWDVLHAALHVLAARLQVLSVAGCFWNQPELFGGLRQLTALTELRLANTPLETAYELRVVASMTQLVQLELGIIFDGSSAHHDVPRALEGLGALQRLQALALPMWRRSLGGRAHPLAPALSAALRRLTGLTNLAVDGKFSQLGVVSELTNLRQLASAAPLSKEGWQAICQLSHLTLLTSLTPALEVLQLNPERPHPGCDLARLAPKTSLVGMDVAVLAPEHLAPIAQFTALQQLNLRCVATFHRPMQQAQVLTAMSCLPSGLTSLSMGPLTPLCAQLFSSIASSCPLLKVLHASFTQKGQAEGADTGAWANAAGGVSTAQQKRLQLQQGGALHPRKESAGYALLLPAGRAPEVSRLPPLVTTGDLQQHQQQQTISQALGCLQQLHVLNLALLSDSERAQSPSMVASASRRSSSYGGSISSPPSAAAASMAVSPPPATNAATGAGETSGASASSWLNAIGLGAAAGSTDDAAGGGSSGGGSSGNSRNGELVQMLLEDLPRCLQHLQLSGGWLLCQRGPSAPAASSAAAAAGTSSSVNAAAAGLGAAADAQPAKAVLFETTAPLQEQWLSGRLCKVCKGSTGAAAGTAASGKKAAVAAASLCECLQGLRVSQLSADLIAAGPASNGWLSQQQQQAAGSPILSAAGRTFNRVSSSSSSLSGSPSRTALSGLKRPASYPVVTQVSGPADAPAADAATGAAALLANGTSGVGQSRVPSVRVFEQHEGAFLFEQHEGAFLFEQQQALHKRSRSLNSMLPPTGTSAHPASSTSELPAPDTDQDSQQQQRRRRLPQLGELCLFKCRVSYSALSELVQSSGTMLSKLQLLQLTVVDSEAAQGAGTAARSPIAREQQLLRKPASSSSKSYLSTQQLLSLPVAWSCLQELHIHPYQLWDMLSIGCMDARGQQLAVAATGSAEQQRLRHVSELLNLRRLFVVNLPTSFAGASPPAPSTPAALAAQIPSVALPLHDVQAMLAALSALQVGLQQLPALRQLLLYLGPVTPLGQLTHGAPAVAEAAADDVWMQSGEALLQALPAVRVRTFSPSIHVPVSAQAMGAVHHVTLPPSFAAIGAGDARGGFAGVGSSAEWGFAAGMGQQQQHGRQGLHQHLGNAAMSGGNHAPHPSPGAGGSQQQEGEDSQHVGLWSATQALTEPEYMI